MKIALITSEFYPNLGGISHTLTNLCKCMQKTKHTFHVFNSTFQNKNCFKVLTSEDFSLKMSLGFILKKRFLSLIMKSLFHLFKEKSPQFSEKVLMSTYLIIKPTFFFDIFINLYNLYPFFQKNNYDIVFGGGSSGKILVLIYLVSKMFKKRVISFVHGNESLVDSKLSLKTFYLKNVDRIILHTHQLKEIIIRMHHVSENLIGFVSTGIIPENYEVPQSKSELRKFYNIPQDSIVIISVGRQVARKNFDLVIKSIHKIKIIKNLSNILYILIGEGPEMENLKILSRKLGLDHCIKFFGNCSSETRNHYYKLSDIFVMPSAIKKNSIEGFGVVYLEANYFKLPVIGAFSGGSSGAIVNNETGLLVKQNNLDHLIEKLLLLIEREDLRKKLGENGYNRVINYFNWNKICQEYINNFQILLNFG